MPVSSELTETWILAFAYREVGTWREQEQKLRQNDEHLFTLAE